jgi:hypothetical protein
MFYSQVIPRNEAETVIKKLTSEKAESRQSILISGVAGVGKSGVILQVLETLHEQGIPVLAFRVDRLKYSLLPDHIGDQLGLPGSPASVLAAIAQKRLCVLIIDQLDAVSFASGHNPDLFDSIDRIIQQALVHSNIRIVLVCRQFDLNNDHKLKRLIAPEKGIADTISVNPLSHTVVRQAVSDLGLNVNRLREKQLDLLSIPLHLGLLSHIAKNKNIEALNFESTKDLYDKFWSDKQDVLNSRLNRPVKWTKIIDALCKSISKKQILSAPKETIDNYDRDAKAMVSEHILIFDGKRYSFFHESFFDYAFARRFFGRGDELLSLLSSSEQDLFRRDQVRQILFYERDIDDEENFYKYL